MRIERYTGVHGQQNVAQIYAALEACNAKVIAGPDPTVAPFDFSIVAPGGTRMELTCYAFTAKVYGQRGRPAGEHRFQVKYGSEFDRYHDLFFDPTRQRITLMFGVHQDMNVFVCVDPQMHNPTWFSRSVEFKEADLLQTQQTTWHGWERERRMGRRKEEMPLEDLRTEAVCGFTPENFLRYVAFEQVASGMETGERLLLWDKFAREKPAPLTAGTPIGHPLEQVLGLSASEVLDVVQEHFRLLVALRGSVAEHHLGRLLRSTRGISEVQALDKDGEADFLVTFEKRDFRIECKNTLRRPNSHGHGRVDFQKTRASKIDPCSRFYRPDQFEVLAACLHPISEAWEFAFCPTRFLPRHNRCPERVATNVVVDGAHWNPSVTETLASLL